MSDFLESVREAEKSKSEKAKSFSDVMASLSGNERIDFKAFMSFAAEHDAAEKERYAHIETQFRSVNARLKRIETLFIGATIALIATMGWLINTLLKVAGLIQ